jgi:DNA-binding NarL/FixJ family response regulator
VDDASRPALVGRAPEREAIAEALRAMPERPGNVVLLEGEPGIGKSRLLGHLAASAAAAGATVLGARASEYESDLPYALWTEALDGHLADLGERRVSQLGLTDPTALAALLPALGGIEAKAAPGDRHRTHRALRDLLERLTAVRPLVLWMDDVHWADPASLDALAALVTRPPTAPLLLGLAAREGQLPDRLGLALASRQREDRVLALRLAPLSRTEAAELVGEAAGAIYPLTGGNPFYLEQVARVSGAERLAPRAGDESVPPAVAAALAAELSALAPDARRLLDGAAVVGDPFEHALAAVVAGLEERVALKALDELLGCALVRPSEGPRRFAFRHPVVRHAVYTATPAGWRLGAHARAAEELERRGAGPVERAHHVEHAAHPGDEEAIEVLSRAAAELQARAPRNAARCYAAALQLLPGDPAQRERRSRMQRLLADAQAAAGDPGAARRTLVDALQSAGPEKRLVLTVALANQEWWLGGHEDARRRLHVALGDLPAQASPDRVRLRLALALMALLACDLDEALAQASDAYADSRAIGDPVFELAALAGGALASASAAEGAAAAHRLGESSAALERLTAEQLATRLPAFWMHGRARRALGEPDASLADLTRGAAIAAETGRERILLILMVESVATLIELGRLSEAGAAADEGLERARLAGSPRMVLWAQSALAAARLAAGDVGAALREAEAAAEDGTEPDFHAAGQPGWCLGAALTAAGRADRAVPVLLEAFGPALARVLPADRPAAAADLVEAQLAQGDIAAAEASARQGEEAAARAATGPARAIAGLARSAVLLAGADPAAAAVAAAEAYESAAGSPLVSARARLAEGKAHAAAGDREAAVSALRTAQSAFAGFAAERRRNDAVRELRQLGHRVQRPASATEGDPLTAREREIAELVASGRTNREIAEQLVLSPRTIEAHLRSIYGKLEVRSRVELTRAI